MSMLRVPPRRWPVRRLPLLAAVITAVVATSCGGGSDANSIRDRRAETTSTAPASTETQAPDVHSVDFRNYTYDLTCGDTSPVVLVNGEWRDPRGPTYGVLTLTNTRYVDATGDGRDDAVLEIGCGVGAGTSIPFVLVFSAEASSVVKVGQFNGLRPQFDAPGEVAVWTPNYGPSDPRCCPSEFARSVYRYDGRIFVNAETTIHSAEEFEALSGTTELPGSPDPCSEAALRAAVDAVVARDPGLQGLGAYDLVNVGCASDYARVDYVDRAHTLQGFALLLHYVGGEWQLLNSDYYSGVCSTDAAKYGIPPHIWDAIGGDEIAGC